MREAVPKPGEVTYRELVAQFLKKFMPDRYQEPTARTAILRAVRRLEREGKLELLYYDDDPNTIGTVRQVRQASPGNTGDGGAGQA